MPPVSMERLPRQLLFDRQRTSYATVPRSVRRMASDVSLFDSNLHLTSSNQTLIGNDFVGAAGCIYLSILGAHSFAGLPVANMDSLPRQRFYVPSRKSAGVGNVGIRGGDLGEPAAIQPDVDCAVFDRRGSFDRGSFGEVALHATGPARRIERCFERQLLDSRSYVCLSMTYP